MVQQKESIKNVALDISEPVVDQMLDTVGRHGKAAVVGDDPAMPRFVRRALSAFYDELWPDARLELKVAINRAILRGLPETEVANNHCCCSPLKLRGLILHHYYPHNKGMWSRLAHPLGFLFYLLSIFPAFGVRFFFHTVIFLLVALPPPPDEV